MLTEILPEIESLHRPKMLTADPVLKSELPDVDSEISFLPFVHYLKQKNIAASEMQSRFFNYLIEKFEAAPDLLQPVNNIEVLENSSGLLELLSTMLFPVVSKQEKNTFAFGAPYQFRVFYYSDCFRQLFLDEKEQRLQLPAGMSSADLKKIQSIMIYDHILEKFYGIKLNDSPELIYPIADAATGLRKYYRIRYDNRFIEVHLKGELPPIQNCPVCLNTFRILDLDQQLQRMPLSLFKIEGFAVWMAEDVTTSESLEAIKKVLLHQGECDTEIVQELKASVKALVGLPEVEVGLAPFIRINNQFVLEEECSRSSLLGKYWKADNPESQGVFQAVLAFLSEHPEPTPVSNLGTEMVETAPFLKPLYEDGYRSYLWYPMQNSEGLLGILELASPVPGQLTREALVRLEPAIPLLSLAVLKSRNSFHTRIEKLIKEKFTALQQSVEWKFEEVAWNYLRNAGEDISNANVIFDNVYPLYGAIDIRNSSQERTHALQKDLKEHLILIDDIFDQLQARLPLALLEGLRFKNQGIRQSIEDTMAAEDEVRINEFIKNEVEPVFSHLQASSKPAQEVVEHYFRVVEDTRGKLYRSRLEYEQSIAAVNEAVMQYLEKQEEAIQQTYPHYFERYRTDGVEYNIYIGQSIAPQHPFDLLYLKNLRLWQLQSMSEAARLTHALLPQLKVPLQTTQLILVHSSPISIGFRRDERRFDVEGSYNIRYEVIKKRLDKALVKDSGERLTQPGKIAIVYSTQKELQEYQQYIDFLQNKKLLNPGMELLELEELQGVKGLKAIRVEIPVKAMDNRQ